MAFFREIKIHMKTKNKIVYGVYFVVNQENKNMQTNKLNDSNLLMVL